MLRLSVIYGFVQVTTALKTLKYLIIKLPASSIKWWVARTHTHLNFFVFKRLLCKSNDIEIADIRKQHTRLIQQQTKQINILNDRANTEIHCFATHIANHLTNEYAWFGQKKAKTDHLVYIFM